MLSAERAQELLKEHRVEDSETRLEAAIGRLPRAVAKVAREVVEAGWWQEGGGRDGADVEGLGARRRVQLFEALIPNLGRHAEAMWQAGVELPYEGGYGRRGFRAPSAPAVSLPRRHQRLRGLVFTLRGFEVPDVRWLARWAPYLTEYGMQPGVGTLLAAAIDGGGRDGDAVFDVLVASANGDDEIGAMGDHVIRGLLTASREDGWELVERLLLAAQRQEGLRQRILEAADEAHPGAFRALIRTVLEHGLTRFSATARALDVWLGVALSGGSVRALDALLERALAYLEDPDARAEAIASGSAEDAYLALWATAHDDAVNALEPGARLLHDGDPERRFAAVHLLAQLDLNHGYQLLAPVLEDDDLRVAAHALQPFVYGAGRDAPEAFGHLERLIDRVPGKKVDLEPILWPSTGGELKRSEVGSALAASAGDGPVEALIPYLDAMDADTRLSVAGRLAEGKPKGLGRRTVVALLGDPSSYVRDRALEAAGKLRLDDDEAQEIEGLLTRKAGDLRRGVVSLLLARGDSAALASADRLLAGGNANQRMGGLEVLRRLVEEERAVEEARRRAAAYAEARGKLSAAETTQLDAIAAPDEAAEAYTRQNALGLLDEASLTPPLEPARHEVELVSSAAIALLLALDELVHEHRDEEVEFEGYWGGTERALLGDAGGFPHPGFRRRRRTAPLDAAAAPDALERAFESVPLAGLWREWERTRPDATRDGDGLELVRALEVPMEQAGSPRWFREHSQEVEKLLLGRRGRPLLRYRVTVQALVEWLALLELPRNAPGFLLDAAETMLAHVPRRAFEEERRSRADESRSWSRSGWRGEGWLGHLERARTVRHGRPDAWTREEQARLWRLERWAQDPLAAAPGRGGRGLGRLLGQDGDDVGPAPTRPPVEELVAAYDGGAASDPDVIHHLFGPPDIGYGRQLSLVSGRGPGAGSAAFTEVVDRGRRRILEIELARGEAPTIVSDLALDLEYSGGLDALAALLAALGRERFVRGWNYDGQARQVVFSRLIRATMPGPGDTPEAFAGAMAERRIREGRQVELAAFAPQWVRHVEHSVGWPGLAAGTWWLHAHSKDSHWEVQSEIRDAWAAEAAERTPLTAADLLDGAVDVDWFRRAYAELGEERWDALHKAAKYGSSSGGHKRAQLFADAMRGTVSQAELTGRIEEKRHQDAVRALGLMPLPRGREADDAVLERYELIQEFVRGSRKFGSQRQASERRAAEIGLLNLARTAGYADPIRLGWAMEARGIADLADGPMTVTAAGAEVTLEIDEDGAPQTRVSRDGRPLKSVPAAARKSKDVKALRSRAAELRRQAARIRGSLESAMVRGDELSGAELHELSAHPLLAPQLSRLVLVPASDGPAGFPAEAGRVLRDVDGGEHALGAKETVRIAHPLDLARARWSDWQREVLAREVKQPFKQVFRELYVPTGDELRERDVSRRYAGNQVMPRKALALLGSRGWVAHPDEGIRRTFHSERVSAMLLFLDGFLTPAEVEDLTVEEVRFTRPGEWDALPIADVPPRVFSEVMRDLDLVVSVAHSGGVDPEASTSTVEMRRALLEETCALLGIENVRVEDSWALVDGELGEYSVHMGSAVVHRRPGGAVCIVPVHGQHRGRIFLPFADDDPKTAEVMAKVLLLARDQEIKDPSILEQIRG